MEKVKLGDILKIKHGYAFRGDFFTGEDTGQLVLTPGNFTLKGGFQETKKFTTEKDFPSEFILNSGDLIVTMTDLSKTIDTIGFSAIVPNNPDRKYLHNQRIGLVRVFNPEFDKGYIYWVMRTEEYQRTIANTSNGATVHHTSPERIYKFYCKKFDLSIQHKIASILSVYDSLIENNTKRIRLLEQMAENLYKEWFVRFRFPGHEHTELVDGLPKGWKKGTLGDIVTFQNGFAFKSEDFITDGRYGIVTIKNVQNNGFDTSKIDKINCIPARMPKYCFLNDGDLLVSLTGNVGRVCRVLGKGYLLNQRVAKLKSDFPFYSYLLFKSDAVFKILNVISYGTAQLNLSPIKASKIKFGIPPRELLGYFEKMIQPLFSEIDSLQRQSTNLARQRDLLLPRLMSGKLEVKA